MEDTIKITAFLVFGLLGVVAIFSICWHQVKKKQMFGLFAQKKQMYKMEDKKKNRLLKKSKSFLPSRCARKTKNFIDVFLRLTT
jgi:hypothetical protein